MGGLTTERIPPPEPGIYPGVEFETYFRWDAANNSTLRLIETHSAAHAKQHLDSPLAPSKSLKFGAMLHKLILESLDFSDRYAVEPEVDGRTKAGKAARAEFKKLSGDKIVVEQKDYDCARAMAKMARAHAEARRFLTEGEPEICIVWRDIDTGVLCKARLDYLHKASGVIADTKSARDASEALFSRAIASYGYHQQAAFYGDGARELLAGKISFVFVAMEKEPPYAVATYEADPNMIVAGRKAYKRALYVYRQCQETGEWPGYQGLHAIALPRWLLHEEGLLEEVA